MDQELPQINSDPAIPPPPLDSVPPVVPTVAVASSLPPIPPPPPPTPIPSANPSGLPKSPSRLPKILLFSVIGLIVVLSAAFGFTKLKGLIGGKKEPEKVTLVYCGLWESEDIMRPVLSDYEASHPGVTVQYTRQAPEEYRERLQNALSQNRGPDIFRIHNTWVPMFKNDLSSLPADIYSAAEYESTFYPVTRRDLRVGANYLAIPLETDGLAMYINNDLLTKANQPVPQNWDELKTTAVAMTKCDSPDSTCTPGSRIVISGTALGNTENVDHWQDILSLLMIQNNVNLNALHQPTAKPAEDVFEFYNNFVNGYRTWDSTFTNSTNEFALGRVGIYFGPSWRVIDIKKINPSLKFSVYPVPQVPVDSARNEQAKTWASYWVETVNRRSANTQAAWELLKYLSSKEVQVKLYQQPITSQRPFGEPYSRVDLAETLKDVPYVNAYLSQAPNAHSWYLVSNTYDGNTGINTRISSLFADALSKKIDTTTLATKVNQLLSEYGITSAP